jgi:hypothetical protein
MLLVWLGWMLRYDSIRRRPYRVLCTGSLLTSEIKRRRARLVLGWGTLGCCRLFIFSVHINILFLKWVPYTQGAVGFPNIISLRHIKSDTRTNRASRPASQPDLQFQPISTISSNSFHSLSVIHPYTISNTHNTKLYLKNTNASNWKIMMPSPNRKGKAQKPQANNTYI